MVETSGSGLFSDHPGGEVDSDLDAHVDELFTTAMERQVAEQRNLNRLLTKLARAVTAVHGRLDEVQSQLARDVGPATDRLGAIDLSVRSSRDALTQQLSVLRAEFNDAVDTVREAHTARADALESRLDELATDERDLGERLSILASQLTTAVEQLDARQEDVGAHLTGLSGRLEESTAITESLLERLGPLGSQLDATREQLSGDVHTALQRQLDDIDQRLRTLTEAVADDLSRATEDTRAQRMAIDHSVQSLADSVRHELHGMHAEFGARLTAELSQLDDKVSTLVANGAAQIAALQDLVEHALGRIVEDLEAGREELRQLLAVELEALSQKHAEGAADARGLLADAAEELRRQSQTANEQSRQLIGRAVEDLRTQSERDRALLAADLGEIRGALADADRVASWTDQVRELQQILLVQQDTLRASMLRQDDTLRATADQLEEALSAAADRMTERADRLEGSITAFEDRASRRLQDTVESIDSAIESAMSSLRAVLSVSLEETRSGVAADLDGSVERVVVVADEVRAVVTSAATEMAEVESLAIAMRRSRELGDEERDRYRRELSRVFEAQVRELTDHIRESVAARDADVKALEERLGRSMQTAFEQTAIELERRLASVVEGALHLEEPDQTPEPDADPSNEGDEEPLSPARRMRMVLSKVPGVGPAKQSILIDTFGDVEALRAADVAQLTAIKGIGPALADAILAAVESYR